MKHRLFNIIWDTDGEEVDLPSEVELSGYEEREIQLEGADILSDEHGWCVISFEHQEVS